MKLKLIKAVIAWLQRNYPYLLKDAVIPDGKHVHKNPRKKAEGHDFGAQI